ncbi:helix-turn-helix transcriptional regulator [Actinomadura barringtoniae]|uniref:Helix-turn-helix transcriptional regulator n=1 Tax=Actinomadura barringtoniae TaxID=1427535 RepID=A0A939PJU8_9ACTN|nr:TetR/AcrR family transcriptional regulator [Actinomadura barringtoniae]MBO2453632.1 helix-turn-helix transcriptional regulator [Actinomadura barringtoniae]
MPQRADARRNRARILAAAEEVFAERGPSASTEEVAARAGLAIGTIFRHFPTKQALLQAIMKGLLERLTGEAEELASADGAGGLFTFFSRTVEQAAHKKTVVELLAQNGDDLQIAGAVQLLNGGIAKLLSRAQEAGAVRAEVRTDEVVALLAAACQGAVHGGWDLDLRQRTLAVIFNGLAPPR